jgi:hypothetical protein
MQMDVWYDTLLQELIETNSQLTGRLEPVEASVESEVIEEDEGGSAEPRAKHSPRS